MSSQDPEQNLSEWAAEVTRDTEDQVPGDIIFHKEFVRHYAALFIGSRNADLWNFSHTYAPFL